MSGLKQYIYQIKTQSGSAMVECCIAILPIILLGSLILEVTYWHTARQRLALAMSQAVDIATVHHGIESVVWQHLKHMRPELSIQAQDVKLFETESEITALFSEFADPVLSRHFGQPTIRHDFLIAQHEKFKSHGWLNGRGSMSGKTILEANTLRYTAVGWHKPYLSWLSAALKLWQGHGRIAIHVTQSAMMQSHRFKPKGNTELTTRRFETNRSVNLLTKPNSLFTLSAQSAKSAQSTQEAQSALIDLNPYPQQSTKPYIPKAWKGVVDVRSACGAGECCSDEPASTDQK